MFASVNLLNLLHFLSLRSDAGAQYEIQVYASAMRDLVREVVPICIEAWETRPTTAA
jgi:thymidylate synthase (FAD)